MEMTETSPIARLLGESHWQVHIAQRLVPEDHCPEIEGTLSATIEQAKISASPATAALIPG